MALMAKKKHKWGRQLKKLRESFGEAFTQEKAAAFLSVPLRTYQNWEQGHAAPPAYVRQLVERILEKYRG